MRRGSRRVAKRKRLMDMRARLGKSGRVSHFLMFDQRRHERRKRDGWIESGRS